MPVVHRSDARAGSKPNILKICGGEFKEGFGAAGKIRRRARHSVEVMTSPISEMVWPGIALVQSGSVPKMFTL